MNIVIHYAVIYRKLVGYYKNESQNYKEQFEEEYSYFQTYRDEQEDTARFRHDWQNHMLVLQKILTVLRPIDSSILFSNLLDNAIEANRKVTADRFIRIRARCVNESLYLEMENPMEGKLQYEGSRLLTTKPNSEAHGFGLKNAEEIIMKYQGQYHIEVKENHFIIQIIFPFALE